MFAIDEVAYASPAKAWPPLGKLFLALSLLISSLISSSILVPLIVLAIGSSLLLYSTAFRFPRMVYMAIAEGIGLIGIGAVIIAFVTSGTTIWSAALGPIHLTLSQEGLNLGALIFTRAVAGIVVMLFFATSTPVPHLAHVMAQLRIPREISELVILVYRYSFLILEQSEKMQLAASCRLGFKGFKNSLRTTSRLAVGLFIRSIDMAERSQVALHCRNFKGDFPSFRRPARMTTLWFALPLVSFFILFAMNSYLIGAFHGW